MTAVLNSPSPYFFQDMILTQLQDPNNLWLPGIGGTSITAVSLFSFNKQFEIEFLGSGLSEAPDGTLSGSVTTIKVYQYPVGGGSPFLVATVDALTIADLGTFVANAQAVPAGPTNLSEPNTAQFLNETTPASITGTIGGDVIQGAPEGTDIFAKGGNDTVLAGRGSYTIDMGGGTRDAVDFVRLDAGITADLSVPFLGRITTLLGDVITVKGWTHFFATNFADTLVGSSFDDIIFARAGADDVSGNLGDDKLHGDDGNDTIRGGNGNDKIFGERDNDSLFGDSGKDTIEGGHGNDTIDGGSYADTLNGGKGNDLIKGGGANDLIRGEDDKDELHGDDGNDTVFGGSGGDTMFGGAGFDSLLGGDGKDLIRGGSQGDTIKGEKGKDSLYGDDGDDWLWGGTHNDKLFGGKHDDNLRGGSGNDTLQGGAGDDSLVGDEDLETGDDLLRGGDGRDTLAGGSGNDTLVGGNDNKADVFEFFNANSGVDLVHDFETGVDGLVFYDQLQSDVTLTTINAGLGSYQIDHLGGTVFVATEAAAVLTFSDMVFVSTF